MFHFLFGKSSKPPKRSRLGKAKSVYRASELPNGLGLLEGIPLDRIVTKLNSSIPADYAERIQYRVKTEHPRMTEDEYACKWFELKRYFVMSLVMKSTPMFSSEIDDLWHEMLMFTREYQRFGEQFAGGVIHHSPEREPKMMPGERAWFDWVYAHLFEFAPSSKRCWNGFFRNALDPDRTELLREGNVDAIARSLFNMEQADRYPEVAQTIRILVEQAILEANKAAESRRLEDTGWDYSTTNPNSMLYLAGAMMFFSIQSPQSYADEMNTNFPENSPESQRDKHSSCSSSGCGSSAGSCDNSGDQGGGSSSCSSDSSGSSSSSCSSSSCSSSSCGSS
ncbi:hypothetical protein HZF08_37090 [Paenibacillus sp. CGMCC 1.16610]|uniref:Uncharacterized protein n=1 Tax=Paenibacillus anseongense TaxID=2682845 RepID=A0ABW9UCA9_9BACL|nr:MULTISPECIES: hypothetical protein [Paenibacillus]MBA2943893.1 hypothetical protein [Paenibacillus sp. CGMCC 1.16610]MVQ37782.1 hypothetical protein [Paenibacillus anseongense]